MEQYSSGVVVWIGSGMVPTSGLVAGVVDSAARRPFAHRCLSIAGCWLNAPVVGDGIR